MRCPCGRKRFKNCARFCQRLCHDHSGIGNDKRPVMIVHDTPDEVVLPDKQDEAAFNDVYIVKGEPANEVILRRAEVPQAHSVVILSDDRQDQHADGKPSACCMSLRLAAMNRE